MNDAPTSLKNELINFPVKRASFAHQIFNELRKLKR
jgi:hypothetical protein